jgi:hypothetical protein
MEKTIAKDEVLSFEEIKKLYPDEWILLRLSDVMSAKNLRGIILFHSKDYLELCYKGSEIAQNILTKTFYTGESKQNRKWLKATRLKDLPTTT